MVAIWKIYIVTYELYCEIKGSGHNVVLLHGWGMHGGFWGKFNELLSNDLQTHALDLPGFGFSKDIKNEFTLNAITEVVEEYISKLVQPVSLIGWSLGGLITLNILKRKRVQLDKIVLIATTPSFTKKTDWTSAVDQVVFDGFSKELIADYKKTLKRFLASQTRGSELAKEDLRDLKNKLKQRGDPALDALKSGLKILSETDLRNNERSEIPVMTVLGEKDTLVPARVESEFKNMFSNYKSLIIEKSGHAPFISKPEFCAEKIKNFINEQ
ncbi:MAG: pimeloyl-ACP methyl ester esterase BioH [Gammaproteobacteria bacterium]|nr:MAG: pimeloyl-ACP methyl ester esterase BioH [Gammaproteobacteria bacterium]